MGRVLRRAGDATYLDEVELTADAANLNAAAASAAHILNGTPIFPQAAPAAETVTAAITAAELVGGLITTTGVTAPSVHQLPTGALIDDELPGIAVDEGFYFSIINTGTGAGDDATITVNTGVTIVGNPTVGSLTDATIISGAGRFFARRTAADTYVVYRVS
jgi:hypothetical protein